MIAQFHTHATRLDRITVYINVMLGRHRFSSNIRACGIVSRYQRRQRESRPGITQPHTCWRETQTLSACFEQRGPLNVTGINDSTLMLQTGVSQRQVSSVRCELPHRWSVATLVKHSLVHCINTNFIIRMYCCFMVLWSCMHNHFSPSFSLPYLSPALASYLPL